MKTFATYKQDTLGVYIHVRNAELEDIETRNRETTTKLGRKIFFKCRLPLAIVMAILILEAAALDNSTDEQQNHSLRFPNYEVHLRPTLPFPHVFCLTLTAVKYGISLYARYGPRKLTFLFYNVYDLHISVHF